MFWDTVSAVEYLKNPLQIYSIGSRNRVLIDDLNINVAVHHWSMSSISISISQAYCIKKERHNTLFINAFIQISIYPLYEVTRKCTFLYLTLCPLSEYENDNKWDKLKA